MHVICEILTVCSKRQMGENADMCHKNTIRFPCLKIKLLMG
jgi:hypothetical protein